jgi:hypothetical protein
MSFSIRSNRAATTSKSPLDRVKPLIHINLPRRSFETPLNNFGQIRNCHLHLRHASSIRSLQYSSIPGQPTPRVISIVTLSPSTQPTSPVDRYVHKSLTWPAPTPSDSSLTSKKELAMTSNWTDLTARSCRSADRSSVCNKIQV